MDRRVSSFVTGYLLPLSLLLPIRLPGQDKADSQAMQAASPTAQSEPLALPRNAQEFKFTKVDLELLRQVNAFDKYIEERGWVYHEPGITDYLEKIGLSLVPKQTPESVQWRFRAIRDLEANAFALPNGSVYVNSGLLTRLENEAQLAGVLAHEITHVVNRHTYLEHRSKRKKMVAINVMLAAVSAVSYPGGAFVVEQAMGDQLPTIVGGTIFGYRQELAHEADVRSIHMLSLRNYDLREFSRGLDLLRSGPEVELSRQPVFWTNSSMLTDRAQHIGATIGQLQPNSSGSLVNRPNYYAATFEVFRQHAALGMLLGRPRTALATALRLTAEDPNNAENYVLLGDAYRSLGARTPLPEADELTNEAKEQARLDLKRMTIAENERALLADQRGPERWQANFSRAEKAFHRALEMDANNATAHRGLGYLFESNGTLANAIAQFKMYLELAPQASDARQIKLHVETLEHPASAAGAQTQKSTRAQ